jgi:hypothetical protein
MGCPALLDIQCPAFRVAGYPDETVFIDPPSFKLLFRDIQKIKGKKWPLSVFLIRIQRIYTVNWPKFFPAQIKGNSCRQSFVFYKIFFFLFLVLYFFCMWSSGSGCVCYTDPDPKTLILVFLIIFENLLAHF